MKPTPPTCAQIADEELGRPIWKQELSGWRHGFHRTAVYARVTDTTFWRVSYRVSTDGEYNGLRDGEATIEQVEPYEETVTHYRTISTP